MIRSRKKVLLVPQDPGRQHYEKAEEGLPMDFVPSIASMRHDAIMEGYYLAN